MATLSDSTTHEKVPFLYWFARTLSRFLFRTIWRLEIFHQERIPATGPLIVSANHRSYFDPPLVGVAVTRAVHFLAKKELFSFKPFGWAISQMNAHPLNRDGDIGAFKSAMKILNDGGAIIIFPEGRRSPTDEFRSAKPGVGLLARKCQVPILPIYIENSGHWMQGKKIRVVFGHPIDPSAYTTNIEVGNAVMDAIRKLQLEKR